MEKSVYVIQPTYRMMDGRPIRRVPVFNYTCNLPILSATIPADYDKRFCLEYCETLDYKSEAPVILVTSAGYDIAHALDIVRRFKRRGKIVIAGANADALSDRLLGEYADAIFAGYPDPSMMRRMLDDATKGSLQRRYGPDKSNMDFALDYDVLRGKDLPYIPVLASLGCRNACSYCCYPPQYHGRYYLRPLDKVLADLASAASFKKPVAFLDANLYNNREYLLRLCNCITSRGIRCDWGAQCTINIADDTETLDALHRAGCRLLVFGLESLRQENMLMLNKSARTRDYAHQLKSVRHAGIRSAVFFMVGMDGDDAGTFQEIEDFVGHTPISVPFVHLLVPVPGTALFDRLRAEGRLTEEAFDKYEHLDPRYSVPCSSAYFLPKTMSTRELEDRYVRLAKRLTSLSRVARRCLIPNIRIAGAIWAMNMDARRFVRGMALQHRD